MNATLAVPGTAALQPWADLGAEPDAERLREALQRSMPECNAGEWTITELRLSKVRRSSSKSRHPNPISMCIDLDLRESSSGRILVQRLYAKAYRNGASAQAFSAALQDLLVAPPVGSAVLHVASLDMVLWAWPNDPSLPQLAVLTDRQRLAGHLAQTQAWADVGVHSVEVLRYEPERRATLRCELNAIRAGQPGLVAFGKTFADDKAQALQERFQSFWRLAGSDEQAPAVAEPLGWDPATRTLWQAQAKGIPLLALVNSTPADAVAPPGLTLHAVSKLSPSGAGQAALEELERTGRALACLHLCALPVSTSRSTDYWINEVRLRVQKISRAAPDLKLAAQQLAVLLEGAAEQAPRACQTLIHGDFHPEQVWVDGARIVFFDFDEFASGNPMEDLAEFIVKLEQCGASRIQCSAQVQAFVNGYREAQPKFFDANWLQWHMAVQTLLQASRSFIYQQPGWRVLMAERLQTSLGLASSMHDKANP